MRALRRGFCCFLLGAVLLAAAAASGQEEEKIVRLRDGTVLRGTLVPSAEGVFRVKTRTLGEVTIDPAEILSIESPAGTAAGGPRPEQLEKLKSEMVNNPKVMAAVQELAQDSKIAEILQDEDLQAAIMSLDFDYLRQSDKFKAFTEHPGVQAIVQKVKTTGVNDERKD